MIFIKNVKKEKKLKINIKIILLKFFEKLVKIKKKLEKKIFFKEK